VTALRCADVEARLVDAIDGRLDSADAVRFHAHLEGCAACRERAALWRRLVPEMRGAVAPAPGAMATRRMQIEIERRLAAERGAPEAVTRRRWWVPALALAAAAAAVALWFRAGPPPPVGYAAFGAVRGAVTVGDRPAAPAGVVGARVPIGAPIALDGDAALTLVLDGGATLAVDGPGRLALEGSARAVAVRLSAGVVRAEVAHRRADQTFAVLTSDLRVEVRGTKFVVAATPAGSRVDVTEGHVAVRFADGRQTLVSAGAGASTLPPEPPREQPAPEAQAPHPSGDERSLARGGAAQTGAAAGRCVEVARSCETTARAVRATMRGGRWESALRQIADARRELRAAGPRCEESASACEDELGYLHAEVLNQAGRLDDAVAAYRALDRRGAPPAMRQNALYAAGQIERRQGRPAAAASDFERALAAAPRGALREDALVGAMESAQAAGQTARARALAGRYLREHPGGLAAPAAGRLTGRGGP